MPEPARLALVIAVDSFTDPRVTPLPGAKRDGERMRELLEDKRRGACGVTLLSNPERAEILDSIGRLLVDAGREGTAIIYIASHGAADASGGLRIYATDTREDDLVNTAVSVRDDIGTLVAGSLPAATVIIFDVCHAGSMDSALGRLAEARLWDEEASGTASPGGHFLFGACSSQERAGENDEGGWFTRSLLAAIDELGSAQEHEQFLSLPDLAHHVLASVAAQPGQHPTWSCTGVSAQVYLSRNPAYNARTTSWPVPGDFDFSGMPPRRVQIGAVGYRLMLLGDAAASRWLSHGIAVGRNESESSATEVLTEWLLALAHGEQASLVTLTPEAGVGEDIVGWVVQRGELRTLVVPESALFGTVPGGQMPLSTRDVVAKASTTAGAPADGNGRLLQALRGSGFRIDAMERSAVGVSATRITDLRSRFAAVGAQLDKLYALRMQPTLGEYIEPVLRNDDAIGEARAALDTWLVDPGRPVGFVTGEFGSGKSSILVDWSRYRWRAHGDGPLPVLVLLGDSTTIDPVRLVLVATGLTDDLANRAALHLLLVSQHLVICFDGFDEASTSTYAADLPRRVAELTAIASRGGRVVLSSRDHYFLSEERLRASELMMSEAARAEPTRRYRTQPFDEARVEELVTRMAGDDAVRILARIRDLKELRDLASRPLLLTMLVRTLDTLTVDQPITLASLYMHYLQGWLAQTDVGEAELFNPHQKQAFARALASTLWRSGRDGMEFAEFNRLVHTVTAGQVPDGIVTGAALVELAGGGYVTMRAEATFGFAHRSFLEYFMARSLVDPLAQGDLGVLDTQVLSPVVCEFMFGIFRETETPHSHPAVEAVRRWLANRASVVEYDATSRIAGNAFRILLGCQRSKAPHAWIPHAAGLQGVDLSSMDLSGLDLSGANLSGAVLRATSLAGTRLDDTTLDDATMDDANLDGASFERAQLSRTSFQGAAGRGVSFRAARLSACDLRATQWQDASWIDTSFDHSRTTGMWCSSPSAVLGAVRRCDASARVPQKKVEHTHFAYVCWSPDGKLLGVAGPGTQFTVWDAHCGVRIAHGELHGGSIWMFAWSPDGKHVATASSDRTAAVWEVPSLRQMSRIHPRTRVTSVSWSPDGAFCAVHGALEGSGTPGIIVWRPENGAPVRHLPSSARATAWHPDGRLTFGQDGQLDVFDRETWQPTLTFRSQHDRVSSARWSGDGSLLVAISRRNEAVCAEWWDINSQNAPVLADCGVLTGVSNSVAVPNHDGSRIAVTSAPGEVSIVSVSTNSVVATLKHGDAGVCAAWSPSGDRVATAGADLAIRLWDMGKLAVDGAPVELATLQGNHRTAIARESGGALVVTGEVGGVELVLQSPLDPAKAITRSLGLLADQLINPERVRARLAGESLPDLPSIWPESELEPWDGKDVLYTRR